MKIHHIIFNSTFCSPLDSVAPTSASRPVILVHGLLSSALHMNDLAAMIKDKHPDTDVHNIDAYSDGVRCSLIRSASGTLSC